MIPCFSEKNNGIPIHIVTNSQFENWQSSQSTFTKEWLQASGFKTESNNIRLVPDNAGKVSQILAYVQDDSMWSAGALPFMLPEGLYQLKVDDEKLYSYAIAWGLGAYQFSRYKKTVRAPAQLYLPQQMADSVQNAVEAIYLVRDCINTPANNMQPSDLAKVAKELAGNFGAEFSEIVGEDLLQQNYPSIYAVGCSSDNAPRLLDLRWGNSAHPKVTLVGKGVCFDSGGLDLKSSAHMLLMKKDMGGAAHVLGLARMIMQAKLPIRLRVLIPAVENLVSAKAYRPGDIIKSRKGLTVEIGNTDAEGRVVLSDALAEAVTEKPDLLIDIATLTGAARVALGTDLPAVFSNQDDVVHAVIQQGEKNQDRMWRLPLYGAYRELLNSNIADINNNSSEPYGGAITAALFLKEFVPDEIPWLHFDMMAWNLRNRPGRPQGGEAMVLRALFAYLQERY